MSKAMLANILKSKNLKAIHNRPLDIPGSVGVGKYPEIKELESNSQLKRIVQKITGSWQIS